MEFKAIGRRKSSVAKVILTPGTGKITVNNVEPKKYFPNDLVIQDMELPLVVTNTRDKFDVKAKATGGGFTGQAGAIRLAIARALELADPAKYDEKDGHVIGGARLSLKPKKLLTSDARVKERKKMNKKGARKSPQFVKR
ncbi:MAG: 30S ribosomal protein S9 [Mycoplasmataceae bacterium]|jgi:small subunit ribosomal protein S9|nr:30S ribosomal protein S9 [Mycoplasmataceae bacterium]